MGYVYRTSSLRSSVPGCGHIDGCREGYNLLIPAEWLDPGETTRSIAWARETYDAMHPYCAPDRYVNYLDQDEAGDAVRAAYGPNYARLRSVKTKYGPTNVFHLNQNILPEG
jgi:hypothetical protein